MYAREDLERLTSEEIEVVMTNNLHRFHGRELVKKLIYIVNCSKESLTLPTFEELNYGRMLVRIPRRSFGYVSLWFDHVLVLKMQMSEPGIVDRDAQYVSLLNDEIVESIEALHESIRSDQRENDRLMKENQRKNLIDEIFGVS